MIGRFDDGEVIFEAKRVAGEGIAYDTLDGQWLVNGLVQGRS